MQRAIDLMPAALPSRTTEQRPEYAPAEGDPKIDKPYVVIVYNDDWHSFADVQIQLQKATGCSLERAKALSIEIDATGRAIVFTGDSEECERVANILRQIKLQVETDRA